MAAIGFQTTPGKLLPEVERIPTLPHGLLASGIEEELS